MGRPGLATTCSFPPGTNSSPTSLYSRTRPPPYLYPLRMFFPCFPKVIADSGYGSEENYCFMDEAGIKEYLKYNRFHIKQRLRYKPDPFHPDCLYHNAKENYYVNPMGQRMSRIGTSCSKIGSGYVTEKARYRAVRCERYRCLCYKAKKD